MNPKNIPQPAVVKPPIIDSDDDGDDENFAGDKFAHRNKARKGNKSSNSSCNGFSNFVREQARKDRVPVTSACYSNPKYSDAWKNLSPQQKEHYKNQAKQAKNQVVGETQRNFQERKDDDDELGEEKAKTQVYEYTAGRDQPEDLLLLHALYTLLEHEQIEQETRVIKEIQRTFPLSELQTKRIFVLNCIPVSQSPDPIEALHAPLELSLVSFSIAEGLQEFGFHAFLKTGVRSVLVEAPLEKHWKDDYVRLAERSALTQVHTKHMIPFVEFEELSKDYDDLSMLNAVEKEDDWWDVAKSNVKFSDQFAEIYEGMLDFLRMDEEPSDQPPVVFVKLEDLEMATECLEWLRQVASKQLRKEKNDPNHITETELPKLSVCSLEHLAWYLMRSAGLEVKLEDIEKLFCFEPMRESKCAYHDYCPTLTQCARGRAKSHATRLHSFLVKTVGHVVFSEMNKDDEEQEELSENEELLVPCNVEDVWGSQEEREDQKQAEEQNVSVRGPGKPRSREYRNRVPGGVDSDVYDTDCETGRSHAAEF